MPVFLNVKFFISAYFFIQKKRFPIKLVLAENHLLLVSIKLTKTQATYRN